MQPFLIQKKCQQPWKPWKICELFRMSGKTESPKNLQKHLGKPMQHEHFFNASCFQVPGAHGSFWTTPKSKNHVKWDPFFKYIIRYLYWLPLKWRKMIQKKYLHPNGQQQQHLETPQFYYSFTHFCWWELVATLKKKRPAETDSATFVLKARFKGGFDLDLFTSWKSTAIPKQGWGWRHFNSTTILSQIYPYEHTQQ